MKKKLVMGIFFLLISTGIVSGNTCGGRNCYLEVGDSTTWNDWNMKLESVEEIQGELTAWMDMGEELAGLNSGPEPQIFLKSGSALHFLLTKITENSITFDAASDEIFFDVEKCIDTDGGKEIYEFGNTKVINSEGDIIKEEEDACRSSIYDPEEITYQYEYYCENLEIKEKKTLCSGKCENGVCYTKEQVDKEEREKDLVYGIVNLYIEGSEIVADSRGKIPFVEFWIDEEYNDGFKIENFEHYEFPEGDYQRYFIPCKGGEYLQAYSEPNKGGVRAEEKLPSNVYDCAWEAKEKKRKEAEAAERAQKEEERKKRAATGTLELEEICYEDRECKTEYCGGTCQEGGFFKRMGRFFKNLFWKDG